jgi:hypothetical protein
LSPFQFHPYKKRKKKPSCISSPLETGATPSPHLTSPSITGALMEFRRTRAYVRHPFSARPLVQICSTLLCNACDFPAPMNKNEALLSSYEKSRGINQQ